MASFAKQIASLEKADRQTVDDCFTAGLLHDTGKVILSSAMSTKYKEVLKSVRQGGTTLIGAEKQILGCNHAEIAAYLLGLWGLPEAVIEGVAWHHDPSGNARAEFSTSLATHVATFFHEQQSPFWMQDGIALSLESLEASGCAGRIEAWKKAVEESSAFSNLV